MILTFQFEIKFFIEISEGQFLQQTTTEDERLERDDTEARPKKVLLKISQNSQENKIPVPESFFSKVAGLRPTTLFKKDSGTDVFL